MDVGPASEALVEYDYDAQHGDELTIRIGDVVTELSPTEPGWMRGKLRGKVGVFPDNFVKMMHRSMARPSAETTTGSLTRDGAQRRSQEPAGRPSRRPGQRRCRALFSYTPEKKDELALKLDDVIDILDEIEPGWWKGSLNGKVGVFPSNFVEELPAADSEPVQEIKPKPVKGVALGDILRDAKARPPPPQLPRPPDLATVAGSDSPAPQLPPKPVKEMCRVLYAYERQNEDELTLKEGDIVTIVSKESDDKGWWRGELAGKVGVFPDNFVETISATEKPVRPGKPPSKSEVTDNGERPAGREPDASKRSSLPQQPTSEAAPPSPSATVSGSARKLNGDTSLEEFDAVERGPDKLTHITADRARAPGRRPTSALFSRDNVSPQTPSSTAVPPVESAAPQQDLVNGSADEREREQQVSTSPTGQPAPPWIRELQKAQIKRISRIVEAEDPAVRRHSAPPERATSAPWRRYSQTANSKKGASIANDEQKASGDSVPEASVSAARPARPDLPAPDAKARKPVKPALPMSTEPAAPAASAAPLRLAKVPSPAPAVATPAAEATNVQQLQEEVERLQKQLAEQGRQFMESLTALRSDYTKRMRTVLDELDSEKKARLVMQVQLDRLDKLVKDMNFSV